MRRSFYYSVFITILFLQLSTLVKGQPRRTIDFNKGWKFQLGNDSLAFNSDYNDSKWRSLQLPHDWSIEADFSKSNPATNQGGALPGGIGWYRKTFTLPFNPSTQFATIEFDGVYKNSEVWINGHYLGKRPNGYISFRYDLSSYLLPAPQKNLIAIKVDNSQQPDSRWYTGSGIYRDVKLVVTNKLSISPDGIFVVTALISGDQGESNESRILKPGENLGIVNISTEVQAAGMQNESKISLMHTIYDATGKKVASHRQDDIRIDSNGIKIHQGTGLVFTNVRPWSVDSPYLYKVVTTLLQNNKALDEVTTMTGVRKFHFDPAMGFYLNNKHTTIKGVCMHHDLGALGAAFNKTAARRQLTILKEMGCNAIRVSHNPPAAAFLDLCDEMGFLVMDEFTDMWQKRKNKFDYHQDFKEWHKRDLQAMVLRDRNHPSIFSWSIGNEIREQFDSTGITITRELAAIVKSIDPTRPVTCALTENIPEKNFIFQSGALDILGFNYKPEAYPELPKKFPGKSFIATETVSALATRSSYDFPADTLRIWPPDSKQPFTKGNADMTVSAYDHAFAYWGATHEQALLAVNEYDHIAGCFVWSGFDFLGEPVPYPWPARSSYYGIVDLAGFPKDVYYMYQSVWTEKPVLHIVPHWSWQQGQEIDIWVYYNNADDVELYLNNVSLGRKKKEDGKLHAAWKVPFQAGTLKAISRKNGHTIKTKTISTAGKAARMILQADRTVLKADGNDLSFVQLRIADEAGNAVTGEDQMIQFTVEGPAKILGTDNGFQADSLSLSKPFRKTWKGLALVIIQSTEKKGNITLRAKSPGLPAASLILKASN